MIFSKNLGKLDLDYFLPQMPMFIQKKNKCRLALPSMQYTRLAFPLFLAFLCLAPKDYLFSNAKDYIILEQGLEPLEMFEEDMYA